MTQHQPRPLPPCSNCGEDDPVKRPYPLRGLCNDCYNYRRRTGRMRTIEVRKQPFVAGICRNCRIGMAAVKGLCPACHLYHWRTGKMRTLRHFQRRETCKNCGRPRSSAMRLAKGRCKPCDTYWKRSHRERPPALNNAPLGWCDCGQPATHSDVLFYGERFNLCDSCAKEAQNVNGSKVNA